MLIWWFGFFEFISGAALTFKTVFSELEENFRWLDLEGSWEWATSDKWEQWTSEKTSVSTNPLIRLAAANQLSFHTVD